MFVPGLRQLARRVGFAENQPCPRFATALTGQIKVQNRVDAVCKRKLHRGTTRKHDDNLFARFHQSVGKRQLIIRKAHMYPIAALAFGKVCKSEIEKNGIIFSREGNRFRNRFAFRRVDPRAVPARIPVFYPAYVKGIFVRNNLCRRDHRTAGSLIAHFFKQLADDAKRLCAVQRERAVVLHQHRAVRRDLCGKLRMTGAVKRFRS